MKNWEKFESESLLYIQKEFGNLATFVGVGSHDSTVSDIKVIKDGETVFFILKLLLVIVFLWLASPVASHLISRLEVTTNETLEEECEVKE